MTVFYVLLAVAAGLVLGWAVLPPRSSPLMTSLINSATVERDRLNDENLRHAETILTLHTRIEELEEALRHQSMVSRFPTGPVVEEPVPAERVEIDLRSDDLTRIKGIGPKIAQIMESVGITTFKQVSELDDEDADRIAQRLGSARGKMQRTEWAESARVLVTQTSLARTGTAEPP